MGIGTSTIAYFFSFKQITQGPLRRCWTYQKGSDPSHAVERLQKAYILAESVEEVRRRLKKPESTRQLTNIKSRAPT